MDMHEIKDLYLNFMKNRGWPIRQSGTLAESTFPHCFTISGAVDFFNKKIRTNPFEKEGFAYCVRCFRHYDEPDRTHLPFFWMLLTVSWDLYSREKAIVDNADFAKTLGLDTNDFLISCWQGGRIYGKGINLKADYEKTCQGPEFDKMQKEGIHIPKDQEAISTWKKCGFKPEQIVECGETGALDTTGFDSILLNAREHFAGVRSEPYYKIKKRYIEIGVNLSEEYIKRTVIKKGKIPDEIIEKDAYQNTFLLHLKSRPVTSGYGLERLLMAMNDMESVFELEPFKTIINILLDRGRISDISDGDELSETVAAYIPAIVWLINDGAHHFTSKDVRQKRGIYRKVLKTVIKNLRTLNLDYEDIYLELFDITSAFYNCNNKALIRNDIAEVALKEINKQKKRIEQEEKQLNLTQVN